MGKTVEVRKLWTLIARCNYSVALKPRGLILLDYSRSVLFSTVLVLSLREGAPKVSKRSRPVKNFAAKLRIRLSQSAQRLFLPFYTRWSLYERLLGPSASASAKVEFCFVSKNLQGPGLLKVYLVSQSPSHLVTDKAPFLQMPYGLSR